MGSHCVGFHGVRDGLCAGGEPVGGFDPPVPFLLFERVPLLGRAGEKFVETDGLERLGTCGTVSHEQEGRRGVLLANRPRGLLAGGLRRFGDLRFLTCVLVLPTVPERTARTVSSRRWWSRCARDCSGS